MARESCTSRRKYADVSSVIRQSVVSGHYGSGQRLPTRVEMAEMFGTSVVTVQRALRQLTRDGFVRSRVGDGTFVVDHPPHLCNYGLVACAKGRWTRLHAAISKAAEEIESDSVIQFKEYLTSTEPEPHEDVARLCRDVVARRVGGLILTTAPDNLVGTPALEAAGMPRVMGAAPGHSIPVVRMDISGSFITRAVEYLRSRGRRRIAHLHLAGAEYQKNFAAALARTGIEVRPYWVQTLLESSLDETAANIVILLMELEGDKRPDALIIHDDNLIEHVLAGLMSCGVRVPDELEIVSHFNYPALAPALLPMKRLGFDCRTFLRKCVEVLEMQRRGETPPMETYLPALFEDELETGAAFSS